MCSPHPDFQPAVAASLLSARVWRSGFKCWFYFSDGNAAEVRSASPHFSSGQELTRRWVH